LALLGDRVPVALKVFLTALAVMDDLGAILTIAIFYSNGIQWAFLGAAMGLFAFMVLLNRLKVHRLWPYLLIGPVMWYCMLESGVHATIAGVLLAFAIPFGNGDERSPSYRLQHFLHRPVAFGIMPLFALANTCIALAPGWLPGLLSPDSLGIFFGLVIGKPLGIALFAGVGIALGWCALPEGTRFTQLIGVGFLAGIGFTMSIFITLLAFDDPAIVLNAKTAILASSLVAALAGAVWIKRTLAP
jgi:NhaA family Na+:H+ antiporter